MKYYVVSDVHGFYTPLVSALKEKGFFDDKEPHKLIVCGDLFDRGEEAEKIQEFICDLLEKDLVILIRGNHEDLVEELVENFGEWMTIDLIYSHHWHNQTPQTVFQLTHSDLYEATTMPKRVSLRMKETPFFKKILPAMVDYYETEKYIFVHGWIPADGIGGSRPQYFYPIENWSGSDATRWREARWFNGMLAASCDVTEPGKTIVCGHWHTSYGHSILEGKCSEFGDDADFTPYYGEGIIAIDACTAHSGFVNCIVLEDEELQKNGD